MEARSSSAGVSVESVWRKTLGASDDDELFLEAFSSLLVLARDARSEAEALPGVRHDLHLAWKDPVKQLLTMRFFPQQWGSVAGLLPNTVMLSMEFCSFEISRGPGQERVVPEKDLDELRQEIDALLSSVVQSECDAALQRFIVRQLHNIQNALLMYRLRGADAIRDGLDKATGAMFFNLELLEHDPALRERLKKLLGKTYQVIAGVVTVAQLPEATSTLLGLAAATNS